MSNLVDILLASYNGEKYLPEQLNSLLNQSFTDFRILIRDDGSSDGTYALIENFARRYPEKIVIIPSEHHLGVIGNFNALLNEASAEYIFFSDQDDVWEPNKIEMALSHLKNRKEATLVHSDLKIVDSNLNVLHPSFFKYSDLNPEKGRALNRLLVQNYVTGCTVGINKALKELIYPIPDEAIMHDWWMSLTASLLGTIISIKTPTILYRQHASNVLGANQIGFREGLKRLFLYFVSKEVYTKEADLRQNQAKALHTRFKEKISQNKLHILETFLKGPEMRIMERKWNYLTCGFYRQGLKKTLPYLLQNRPF